MSDYKVTLTKSPPPDGLSGEWWIYEVIYTPYGEVWSHGLKKGTEAQVRSYAETVITKRKNSPSCLQFNKVKAKKPVGIKLNEGKRL